MRRRLSLGLRPVVGCYNLAPEGFGLARKGRNLDR
jgi:hypothetical protein